ncbi:MAG: nucleoside triphosphate pyrophosphohydrolase, partial [Coriobacteriales bacterium]|nr:nucleoside triphosphate pyrophosphohydrolase [Coriobacteriales bacterium]
EGDSEEAEEEFGDILFTLVNIARWNNIDAETALRRSCDKFRARWAAMEEEAASEGFDLRELDEQGWDELWNHAKLEQAS